MSTITEAAKQWANRPADQRFTSLATLHAAVSNRRNQSMSCNRDLKGLKVTLKNNELVLNEHIHPAMPTHWSFGQLCGACKAPAGYLRTLSPQLVADNLTYKINQSVSENMKFMILQNPDGGANTLQAITGPEYGRIWDADVVESVMRIVERSGGKFHNPLAYDRNGGTTPSGLYASDHDVFMFLIDGGSLLEAGPRAKLNRGFIVWNSETGAKTLGVTAFLFNTVCGNHFIYGATDVQTKMLKHTSSAPMRFDREVLPILSSYVNASEKPVLDSIKRAQDLLLTNVLSVPNEKCLSDAWVRAFAKKYSFTVGEVDNAIQHAKSEEHTCETVWDMEQGLTAAARDYDYIDSRLHLETRASKFFSSVVA
jgi:hypothetical protein